MDFNTDGGYDPYECAAEDEFYSQGGLDGYDATDADPRDFDTREWNGEDE